MWCPRLNLIGEEDDAGRLAGQSGMLSEFQQCWRYNSKVESKDGVLATSPGESVSMHFSW